MNVTDLAESTITESRERGLTLLEHNNSRIRNYIDVLTRMGLKPWALRIIRCTSKLRMMARSIEKIERQSRSRVKSNGQQSVFSVDSGIMFQPPGRPKSEQFHLWRTGVHLQNEYIEGTPGWHGECAALVDHYSNGKLLHHYGGKDLKDLHHKGEEQILNILSPKLKIFWHHTNALLFEGKKMSKSQGNVIYPAPRRNLNHLTQFLTRGSFCKTLAVPDTLTAASSRQVEVILKKLSRRERVVKRWFLARKRARFEKNFALGDVIRRLLVSRGYYPRDLRGNRGILLRKKSIPPLVESPK